MFDGTRILLNQTCSLTRNGVTKNSKNQNVYTANQILYFVPCRLIMNTGRTFVKDKLVTVSTAIIYLPFETDIEEKDIVTIGDDNYDVQFVNKNPGSSSHHVECFINYIKKQN
jgi:hypothetical protein